MMASIDDYRTKQIEQGELWEELRVEHHWFHVVRGMITRGVMRDMGPMAWAVYCALKSHTNLETGEAWPSIATVAEMIGVSHDTVQRAMTRLVEMGIVEVQKHGRKNRYILREQLAMITHDGELFGIAERAYAPNHFGKFVEQLKDFAKSGNLPPDRNITINVTLNVQNITQGDGGNVTMNVQSVNVAGESKAPDELQERVMSLQKRVSKLKYL